MREKKIVLYIDGASKGNPGNAGVGVVMLGEDGLEIKRCAKYLGIATNNEAEYMALLMAVQEAVKLGIKEVSVYSDSELLVRQVQGVYRVKDNKLKQLYLLFDNLRGYFDVFRIEHVRREKNKIADSLAQKAAAEVL